MAITINIMIRRIDFDLVCFFLFIFGSFVMVCVGDGHDATCPYRVLNVNSILNKSPSIFRERIPFCNSARLLEMEIP